MIRPPYYSDHINISEGVYLNMKQCFTHMHARNLIMLHVHVCNSKLLYRTKIVANAYMVIILSNNLLGFISVANSKSGIGIWYFITINCVFLILYQDEDKVYSNSHTMFQVHIYVQFLP